MGPSQRVDSPDQWLELSLESAWRREPDGPMGVNKDRERKPKTLPVKKGGEQGSQKPD